MQLNCWQIKTLFVAFLLLIRSFQLFQQSTIFRRRTVWASDIGFDRHSIFLTEKFEGHSQQAKQTAYFICYKRFHYLVFLVEATGVLMMVFGDGMNVCGLVDLELLFDVHLSPVYGPIIMRKKKRNVTKTYRSAVPAIHPHALHSNRRGGKSKTTFVGLI